MTRLIKWLERPIDFLFYASLVVGVLMMLHVTADVVGRAFFRRPVEGTSEVVAAYYMVLTAYLPWAWVARHDNHIVAGFFKQIGTPTSDFWLGVGVKVLTILYLGVFAYQTLLQAMRQTRAGEVWLAGTQYLPVWPSRWVLPVSAALMLAYLLLRLISDVARGPDGARED